VYLASHAMLRRPTAIKLLPLERAGERSLARFEREVQLTASLSHPNTVTIHDYGRTPTGIFYYVMELLDGATLDTVVELSGPQPAARVIRVIDQVAGALAEAHGVGLIHRDIKPANIMLLADGRVKVTDLSIAQVVDASQTRTGTILGTPSYMSPEQVNGKRIDGRSDLFSLGIVAYELFTGTRPFKGDSMSAILYAISHNAHAPLARVASEIPACVKSIVNRMLAKQMTKRFATAQKALQEINACLDRLR
jgi:serine/threonine protein kinase